MENALRKLIDLFVIDYYLLIHKIFLGLICFLHPSNVQIIFPHQNTFINFSIRNDVLSNLPNFVLICHAYLSDAKEQPRMTALNRLYTSVFSWLSGLLSILITLRYGHSSTSRIGQAFSLLWSMSPLGKHLCYGSLSCSISSTTFTCLHTINITIYATIICI